MAAKEGETRWCYPSSSNLEPNHRTTPTTSDANRNVCLPPLLLLLSPPPPPPPLCGRPRLETAETTRFFLTTPRCARSCFRALTRTRPERDRRGDAGTRGKAIHPPLESTMLTAPAAPVVACGVGAGRGGGRSLLPRGTSICVPHFVSRGGMESRGKKYGYHEGPFW